MLKQTPLTKNKFSVGIMYAAKLIYYDKHGVETLIEPTETRPLYLQRLQGKHWYIHEAVS